jgi:hypothetical protein
MTAATKYRKAGRVLIGTDIAVALRVIRDAG